MGNIISYLRWRGDLSLTQVPFNEADNLVLSALAYLDLTGVVPSGTSSYILLCEATKLFFELNGLVEIEKMKHSFLPQPSLLNELAETNRFCKARLSHYVDFTDDTTQFAALTITLEDNTSFVAFRGTDTTVIGWREDFQMSFQTVPAQKMAMEYLNRTDTNQKIRVGGHSKGGNLAVYASSQCKELVKSQIIEVYDNDGPGFSKEVMNSVQYQSIERKIIRLIPEFSVIGMLFEHQLPCKIVASSAEGILQHDIMTWQIEGNSLIAKAELAPRCRFLNQIFDTWIESSDMEQRKSFTQQFFDALCANGAKQLSQVAGDGIDGFEQVLIALINSDVKTKHTLGNLFHAVVSRCKKINVLTMLKSKAAARGFLYALVGLLFVATPELAIRIIGMNVFMAVLLFAGYKLTRYYLLWRKNQSVGRLKVVLLGILVAICLVFLTQSKILTISVNLVLGAALIASAYFAFVSGIKGLRRGNKLWLMGVTNAVVSLLFGIVALSTMNNLSIWCLMPLGSYLILLGIGDISTAIYNDIKKQKEDFYL